MCTQDQKCKGDVMVSGKTGGDLWVSRINQSGHHPYSVGQTYRVTGQSDFRDNIQNIRPAGSVVKTTGAVGTVPAGSSSSGRSSSQ